MKSFSGDDAGTFRLIYRFASHTIVGVCLFLVAAAAAVIVDYCAKFAGQLGLSSWIVEGLKVAEYFLFAIDMTCLVAFLLKETATFIGALLRHG